MTTRKWILSIILTVLLVFLVEIARMLYHTFTSNETLEIVPWTFHWIWEIAALIGVYFIEKKCDVFGEIFFSTILAGIMLSFLAWSFLPDSFKVLEANYYGIESRFSLETHDEGRYYEQPSYDYSLQTGFLYKTDDPELIAEMKEAAKYNEYVTTKGFLFWQTGLAYGFYPISIENFNGGKSFYDRWIFQSY
jgi:hypothetical protein